MHLERGSADSVSFVSPGCAERLQGHGLAPVPVTVGDTCSPISPPTPPFCCCCRPCAMQVREEAAPAQPPLPSRAVQVAGAAFLSPSASPSTQHASVRRVSLRLSRAAVRPLLSCPCRQSCLTPVAAPPSRPGRGSLPACLCRRWEWRPSGCVGGGGGRVGRGTREGPGTRCCSASTRGQGPWSWRPTSRAVWLRLVLGAVVFWGALPRSRLVFPGRAGPGPWTCAAPGSSVCSACLACSCSPGQKGRERRGGEVEPLPGFAAVLQGESGPLLLRPRELQGCGREGEEQPGLGREGGPGAGGRRGVPRASGFPERRA